MKCTQQLPQAKNEFIKCPLTTRFSFWAIKAYYGLASLKHFADFELRCEGIDFFFPKSSVSSSNILYVWQSLGY